MRTKTRAVVAAIVLTLAVGTISYAVVVRGRDRPKPPPTFRVKGSVKDLYPGIKTVIRAKVTNRYDHAIVVRKVTAKLSSPVTTCPASAVRVKPWRGKLTVPANRTRRVRLPVRMKPTTPDGCQGVRFQVRYGGKAVRR